MPNTKGLRRGTRYMFARDFRKHGQGGIRPLLTVFKVNDLVDVKVSSLAMRRTSAVVVTGLAVDCGLWTVDGVG